MTEIVIEQDSIIVSDQFDKQITIEQDGDCIFVTKENIPALISALQQMQGKKNWREEFDQLMDSISDEEFINWATENKRKRAALQQLNENTK